MERRTPKCGKPKNADTNAENRNLYSKKDAERGQPKNADANVENRNPYSKKDAETWITEERQRQCEKTETRMETLKNEEAR